MIHENNASVRMSFCGKILQKSQKRVEFIICVRVHAVYPYPIAQLFVVFKEIESQRVVELQEIGKDVGAGSRCQNHAAHILQSRHYLPYLCLETEFETFVKLIKHKHTRREHIDIAPVDVIEQPPGVATMISVPAASEFTSSSTLWPPYNGVVS